MAFATRTEKDVGYANYITWPLAATQQIVILETKINETASFLTGQTSEVLALIEKYRPAKEVLETNPEERKIWKEVDQLNEAIKNRVAHITR